MISDNLIKSIKSLDSSIEFEEDSQFFLLEKTIPSLYWGYYILYNNSLKEILNSYSYDVKIITSKFGSELNLTSNLISTQLDKNSDSSKSKWENELFDIWFATKTNDYIFNQNYVVDGKIVEDEKNQDSKSNLWFHLDYYEVINRILKSSSFKLNWVVDPFMNSGSVGLVSKKSGRRFIGFESNQDKLLLSMKRINEGE